MEYHFEEYRDKYFDTLYEMKKDNFKWYVEKVYGWDEKQQLAFHRNFIDEHRHDMQVIKAGDEIIGLFTNYIDESGDSFISLFYIAKEYQRRGIGTAILKEQLEVDRKNKRNTTLRVFRENPARFLYEKVGFEIYEKTETHYKMRREIKGVKSSE